MLIGVPKEIKPDEYRVALTPAGAEMLSQSGHHIVMESGAGLGSGFTDDFYAEAGVELLENVEEVWGRADMIMKVKFSPTRLLGKTISRRLFSSELSIFSVICLLVSSKLKCLTSKFAVPSMMKELPP